MLHQGLIDLAEKGRGDPFKKSEKEMKCESSGGIAERKVKNNIYIYLTRDLTIWIFRVYKKDGGFHCTFPNVDLVILSVLHIWTAFPAYYLPAFVYRRFSRPPPW